MLKVCVACSSVTADLRINTPPSTSVPSPQSCHLMVSYEAFLPSWYSRGCYSVGHTHTDHFPLCMLVSSLVLLQGALSLVGSGLVIAVFAPRARRMYTAFNHTTSHQQVTIPASPVTSALSSSSSYLVCSCYPENLCLERRLPLDLSSPCCGRLFSWCRLAHVCLLECQHHTRCVLPTSCRSRCVQKQAAVCA